jgi:hypothetical protein
MSTWPQICEAFSVPVVAGRIGRNVGLVGERLLFFMHDNLTIAGMR